MFNYLFEHNNKMVKFKKKKPKVSRLKCKIMLLMSMSGITTACAT